MKTLDFIGVDSQNRPVYKDDDGNLWKDVNLGTGIFNFFSVANNDFEGEPNSQIQDEYEVHNVGVDAIEFLRHFAADIGGEEFDYLVREDMV